MHEVLLLPGSACQGPLRMVRGPAHGSLVDAVKLGATPWAPVLVALFIFEELVLLFLIAAGMVQWSPAKTRGSLPKIKEIGTM